MALWAWAPHHIWFWWACSLWHAVQRSLPESHTALVARRREGHFQAPPCLWTVSIVWVLVCLRVDSLEGDHNDCSENPLHSTPAVNIKGDPSPGWGMAWASGARGPEERGSWKEVELSTRLAGLVEAQFCARRPWSHPAIFPPALLCMAPPRGSPGVGPRPLATHECSGPGSSAGGWELSRLLSASLWSPHS